MGMKTSIVYGYGVDHNVLDKVTTMQLVEFLKKHLPKDYADMMADLTDDSDEVPTEEAYEEWLNECSCITSGVEGKFSIISTAISEETKIRFQYEHSGEINVYGILFTDCLPWMLNKWERSCTQEDLDNILKKYFAEFGIEVNPDYIEIEYFG